MHRMAVELSPRQVVRLAEELPMKEKIKLAQKLTEETWQVRFKNLIDGIHKRNRNKPKMSDEEIVRLCKEVRHEIYVKSHHRKLADSSHIGSIQKEPARSHRF